MKGAVSVKGFRGAGSMNAILISDRRENGVEVIGCISDQLTQLLRDNPLGVYGWCLKTKAVITKRPFPRRE